MAYSKQSSSLQDPCKRRLLLREIPEDLDQDCSTFPRDEVLLILEAMGCDPGCCHLPCHPPKKLHDHPVGVASYRRQVRVATSEGSARWICNSLCDRPEETVGTDGSHRGSRRHAPTPSDAGVPRQLRGLRPVLPQEKEGRRHPVQSSLIGYVIPYQYLLVMLCSVM